MRKKSLATKGRIIEFFSKGEVEEKVYFEALKDVLISCQSPIDQKDSLPEYLKSVVTFAYHTGWRKEEIPGLTWHMVDLKAGIVRLERGGTKNDEARIVSLKSGQFISRRAGGQITGI